MIGNWFVTKIVNYSKSFYVGLIGGVAAAIMLANSDAHKPNLSVIIQLWLLGLCTVLALEGGGLIAKKTGDFLGGKMKLDGKRLEKSTEIVLLSIVAAWISHYFETIWKLIFPVNIILLVLIGFLAVIPVYRILSK